MTKKYQRRIIYIYKDFQRSFIFSFCLATFGAMVATSVILLIIFHWASDKGLEGIAPVLIGVNSLVLAALVLLSFIVALLASHKVGGPLFRIEKALGAISKGDLTEKITLRQDDKLKQLAASVNTMTQNLNHKVGQIKQEVLALKEKAGQVGENGVQEDLLRLDEMIDELFSL